MLSKIVPDDDWIKISDQKVVHINRKRKIAHK